MDRLRTLLTGRLTAAAFDEAADLLANLRLSPAERHEAAALLEAAGEWIEGWSARLQLLRAEPVSYGASYAGDTWPGWREN